MSRQTIGGGDLDERIARFLRRSNLGSRPVDVTPLTGDASDRRYYRVRLEDGASRVVALHPGRIDFRTLPFANVAELFRRVPLPVPAILGHDDAEGALLLEDLGDVTLQTHLDSASAPERSARYREATALIERLQRRGLELASERYVPFTLAFDVEKLVWELDFFVRNFLEAYRGAALSDAERTALAEEWAALAAELAAEPKVLCHRDYHSRNLMLHDGTLYIIDFQDARLGPATYDLVSLLRDAYVEVTEREVDELLAHYLMLSGQSEPDGFRRRFDVMAIQRTLKALGTFGHQATARANHSYGRYIPRTLRLVRLSLERQARFGRLRDLLTAHLGELR